jgi:hypothetical protein
LYLHGVPKDGMQLMRRTLYLFLIFLSLSAGNALFGSAKESTDLCSPDVYPDSLRERQILYNGILWKNSFNRFVGDQFLFTNIFLPGTVGLNGKTFVNILIRYDIYSDEIMIPRNLEQIIRLNKEMVDSFSIVFENKSYKFIKISSDSLNDLKGYVNVLYNGRSALYVKYRKDIFTEVTSESDGKFYQVHTIYFMKEGIAFPVKSLKDICRILENERIKIHEFVKENKLKLTRKVPESFVPVIRYYDSLNK